MPLVQVLVEELEQLALCVFPLRDIANEILQVVAVSLSVVDVEVGFNASRPQGSVHANGVTQQQVPRSRNEDGRREAPQVATDR